MNSLVASKTLHAPLSLAGLLCALAMSGQPIENWSAPPVWSAERLQAESENEPMRKLAVPTAPLPFVGITPCRIADTRGAGFAGAYGPPPLAAGAPRNFPLAGQCGIPASAEAVSLNVTVTNTLGPGFILIHPQGGAQPVVSTLNYIAGNTLANAAVVPLGAGGGITVVAGVSGADLILDTNGYYGGSVQTRVTGTCSAGSSIRVVNADGSVVCESDDNTTYSAGLGLSLGGNSFSLNTTFTDGRYWRTGGNSGTNFLFDFLGTTDNTPLLLKVNGQHALRLEPEATSPNLIGGHGSNSVTSGVHGATIAGGGEAGNRNTVTDAYGTVGGGRRNRAGDNDAVLDDSDYATVGGGDGNVASGYSATVGGGRSHVASGNEATVGGGGSNQASGVDATVAGGGGNVASGAGATVPGGILNTASGDYSFAAGRNANANHAGAFVWADSNDFNFSSASANTFRVRATGGARIFTAIDGAGNPTTSAFLAAGSGSWADLSDRDFKANLTAVDGRTVLERLIAMPIQNWNYISQDPSIRHLGPTAQDFRAAFALGDDDRYITTVDASGVALAAIQGLYEVVRQKDARISELEARLATVEHRLSEAP